MNQANNKRAFIDSNVIANWIIISELLKLRKEKEDKKLIKEFHKKIQNSFKLIEKIKNDEITTIDFFTSQFALCEVYNVIGTEYKSKKLSEKRIPYRYWASMIKEIKLKDKHFPEIDDSIKGFVNIFLSKTNPKIKRAEAYKQNDVGYSLWIYNCNTHDGLLLSQAKYMKCNYFITEDDRLIEGMKNNKFGIKICHCETFFREVS